METAKEIKAVIALLSLAEIGPRRYRILLEAFGSISAFLEGAGMLKDCEVKFKEGQLSLLRKKANAFDVGSFKDLNEKKKIRIISCLDAEYPQLLKDIEDFPPVIYVKGRLAPDDIYSVAIVGTRRPTSYGINACGIIARELSGAGITIVSGLARGIDTVAHVNSIASKGRTIAVLGNSLECCYPPENRKLQESIAENGALVSEFPLGTKPDKANFPRRNRIISALSQGVLVVEAGIKSGSLITARYAGEQGKEVFAVPGSIFSKYSEGSNYLIQHGAALAVKAADIVDNIALLSAKKIPASAKVAVVDLNAEERSIVSLLEGAEDGLHQDEIAEVLDLPLERLASCLVGLEIKGVIAATHGARYVRKY